MQVLERTIRGPLLNHVAPEHLNEMLQIMSEVKQQLQREHIGHYEGKYCKYAMFCL